eukprot:CAMPEP_0169194612 /NCGR_PEP_ID=MMETSP1016-20121227/6787_1 /TAXON_ID=342587 /ORGANISM="Karlodinium micrum, Strain CCMP2283" /LENGTH=37 /DNA_ID= /DNA_START= /DNA_END= /DNA_ORIENTATION=
MTPGAGERGDSMEYEVLMLGAGLRGGGTENDRLIAGG